MAASSERRRAGSKILPQVADLIADGRVGEFKIVQHDWGPDFFFSVYRKAGTADRASGIEEQKLQGWSPRVSSESISQPVSTAMPARYIQTMRMMMAARLPYMAL